MITFESMGRREHKDGDEVDYLNTRRPRKGGPVTNHGVRATVKTAHRRRVRRQVREQLRNGGE